MTFAPEGVVLDPQEPPGAFTHGLQLGVAPLSESATYRNAFNRIMDSIQIVG